MEGVDGPRAWHASCLPPRWYVLLNFCTSQLQPTHAVRLTVTAMAMLIQEQGLCNLSGLEGFSRPSMIFPHTLSLSHSRAGAYAPLPAFLAILQCTRSVYNAKYPSQFVSSLTHHLSHSCTCNCLFFILSIGASPPAARAATDPPDTAPDPRSSPPCPLPLSSTPLSLQHATKASCMLSTRAKRASNSCCPSTGESSKNMQRCIYMLREVSEKP